MADTGAIQIDIIIIISQASNNNNKIKNIAGQYL